MASRRDNRSCIISGCVTKGSKGFFRFPSEKNPKQRNAWLKICGLEDVNINDKICSIHFNKYDFFPRRNQNQNLNLKKRVVPSLNLPKFCKKDEFMDVASVIEIETSEDVSIKEEMLQMDPLEIIEFGKINNQNVTWVDPNLTSNLSLENEAGYLQLQQWDSRGSQNHDDHSYANKIMGKTVYDLKEQIKCLDKVFDMERQKLIEEKKKLKLENLNLRRNLKKVERNLENIIDPRTIKGKLHMEKIVRTRLKDQFSEAVLDLLLDKTRHFSKKWSNKDYCFTMLMKMISPKALKLMRKLKIIPLPANSTLKRKFRFMKGRKFELMKKRLLGGLFDENGMKKQRKRKKQD